MFADEIVIEAGQMFKVHHKDILGRYRYGFILPARFAVYKALNQRGWSLSKVGRYFKRDHTTIMHGVARADYIAGRDAEYAKKIAHLVEMKMTPYVEEEGENLD